MSSQITNGCFCDFIQIVSAETSLYKIDRILPQTAKGVNQKNKK